MDIYSTKCVKIVLASREVAFLVTAVKSVVTGERLYLELVVIQYASVLIDTRDDVIQLTVGGHSVLMLVYQHYLTFSITRTST